ncbi:MAG TPA: tetratricopeptide repeat protein, partial [Ruminiclostridium sp.]|nr:tetratricopeptide repeat protein [Ruminiclostridium sp.]
FIAEEFGTKVRWNKKDNLIIVSNKNTGNITVSGQGNIIIAGDNIIVNIFEPYGIDTVYDLIDDADKLLDAKKPEEAISKYKNIIENITEKENPDIFAQVMNNMGNAYSMLAQFKAAAQNTQYAVSAYSSAIRIYSSDKNRDNYYITLNNLANAYFNLWEVTGKKDDLNSAADIYFKILKSGRLKDVSMDIAILDYNIGSVYSGLGKSGMAIESLTKAQSEFEKLLKNNGHNSAETQAMLQYNLGNVYRVLALLTDTNDNVEKARTAYEKALTVMSPECFPMEYAQIHEYLGDLCKSLPDLESNRECIQKAIEEYSESLKFYTPDAYPVCYGRVNQELQKMYALLAKLA